MSLAHAEMLFPTSLGSRNQMCCFTSKDWIWGILHEMFFFNTLHKWVTVMPEVAY